MEGFLKSMNFYASAIGSIYLLFMGILIGTDAHILHYKPDDRTTSTISFIAAGVLYGLIAAYLYFKNNASRAPNESLQRWASQRRSQQPEYVELQESRPNH
jgi:membrane associated rhomboid family serine protease